MVLSGILNIINNVFDFIKKNPKFFLGVRFCVINSFITKTM